MTIIINNDNNSIGVAGFVVVVLVVPIPIITIILITFDVVVVIIYTGTRCGCSLQSCFSYTHPRPPKVPPSRKRL